MPSVNESKIHAQHTQEDYEIKCDECDEKFTLRNSPKETGIPVELNVAENNLILLAANIKPARIISDYYAESRPPERMDANMRKVRAKMQEEDMDTDAITSASIKDTATNAQAKTAHFLSLGLTPNEGSKHEADATIAAVKIKKDGVAIATAVDTNEDKAAAVTAKLL